MIDVVPAQMPRLPEGMAVDGVRLVRVTMDAGVRSDLPLSLQVTADLDGEPEAGEWLDSVAYQGRDGTFQIAVRDSEWLEAKGLVAEPVGYEPRGLRQTVNNAPVGALLYVSLAWRVVEGGLASDDFSTWFAADLVLPA